MVLEKERIDKSASENVRVPKIQPQHMGRQPPRDTYSTDWQSVRKEFIDSERQPAYEELATKYHLSTGAVRILASQEGWPLQRQTRLQQALAENQVAEMLLSVSHGQRAITDAILNFSLVAARQLTSAIEGIESDAKPRVRAEIVNTASFAAANISKALKDVGVIGIPGELAGKLDGKSKNDRESLRHAMQQINVSVQVAQAAARSDSERVEDVV